MLEELAVCEDDIMEEYLEEGRISLDKVQKAVADRQVFPCYFGSALHSQGVEELLDGLDIYIKYKINKIYYSQFEDKEYKNNFKETLYKNYKILHNEEVEIALPLLFSYLNN